MDKQRRKYAIQLANKHIGELPDDEIVKASPAHYGEQLNDNHRLFMWNSLVEHYLEADDYSLYSLYNRHVVQEEPIVKFRQWGDLSPEEQELIGTITQAIWKGNH
jgi:hypothetical protein